jgi:DNA-binding NarL/FixJ family response regulator
MTVQHKGTVRLIPVALLSPVRVICDALQRALAKETTIRVLPASSLGAVANACRADSTLIVLCDGTSPAALHFLGTATHRFGKCRVIVFGLHQAAEYRRFCPKLKARALVARAASLKELVTAIDVVHRGAEFVSPTLGAELARFSATRHSIPRSFLTERERDVADLLVSGQSNKAIAVHLRMSENTVRVHVGHILAKLQAPDRRVAAEIISRSQRHVSRPNARGVRLQLSRPRHTRDEILRLGNRD